jgi:transposase
MNRLSLTSAQRRRLKRQLHETSSARVYRRTLALLECNRGRSVGEIAASLGVTCRSVYNWIATYLRSSDPNSLHDEARAGRPRLWTPQREALLLALLETSPDRLGYFAVNWTVPLLQDQIERVTGLRLCKDTIRRQLQRQDYVWKRFRYVLAPDPDREKKTPNKASYPEFEIGNSPSHPG